MADKTIGELPGISYLDAGSLFVAEQSGQAVKVTGKQLTDFSNVETTAQVEQAKASAQEAKTAQEAAESAILKGPIIQNGTWWVYNQTAGAYQDTGIKATGPQGIPGPTSSVNGISPDSSGNITLTAGNVNAYSKTETDTLYSNNDPRRWGIGGVSKELTSSDDLNTIFENGLYRWGSSVPQNAPTEWPTSYPAYCMMRVWCYGVGDAIQEISSLNYDFKYTMKRICRNNVWTIEWDNPPMELGKEYRTTERYLGKPVYTQIIKCGSIPDIGSEKTTSIAAFNVGVVTFISGWCTYYGAVIEPNIFGIALSANTDNIRFANINREVNSNAVMYTLVKYTKKTD